MLRRAPRFLWVRISEAVFTTSAPSTRPIRSFSSRQSTSMLRPPRGMMFPPQPCRNSDNPPIAFSIRARAAPGKSGEATSDRGPMVTGWQP